MTTLLEAMLPPDNAAWSVAAWREVELVLERRCSRDELIWLADTAGIRVPLSPGSELAKGEILTLLRSLAPRTLVERYHALLAKRRSDAATDHNGSRTPLDRAGGRFLHIPHV